MNTGRTHFKKGQAPWNKGKKMDKTKARLDYEERQRGVTKPKPKNFSEIMRKVNPPKGRKIQYDSRDKTKKNRVWRKGYVHIYLPNHPSSRKSPPDYGYITEHRYVMEKHLSRSLNPKELIHHIDGDKSNNLIENLLLCAYTRKHNEVHQKMQVFMERLIRTGKVFYDRQKQDFCFVG